LAELATVTQLRRSLARYAFADEAGDSPDQASTEDTANTEAAEVAPHPGPETERPRLSMSTVDGRFELSYSAPASIGALVETAIREARDSLFHAGLVDVSLADGLAEVANRSLSAVEGTSRSAKYRIYVHLDTDGGWIGKGGRLPSHIVDAMTCDGVLAPVWETDGEPVSVGRSQRVVPDRTRRLIESRDQGCRYPGCVGAGHVEAHHIVHWRNGGRTDLDQLVSLCPYHHDRHHEGEFTISGTPATPTGLTFWARGGWPIRPLAPDRRVAPDRQERPPATRWVGPTGERLQTKFLLLGRNPSPRAP
jgi:hypothetical protein